MFKRKVGFVITLALLVTINSTFAKMLETKKPVKKIKEQRLEKIQDRVEELAEKLNLTEEQKIKATEVLTRDREKTTKVLEEAATKIEEIKNNTDAEIEGLLTEEQKNKFRGVPEDEEEKTWLKIFK